MKSPRFSVIVPSYNRARYLPEMVESVTAQAGHSVEIVLIDDGSTDDTAGFCARYPDLITYRYQANQGIPGARNTGLQIARGELISLLDSDDLFLPGKFDAEEEAFARFPEADVLSSDSEKWLEGRKIADSWRRDCGMPDLDAPCFLSEVDPVWVDRKIAACCALTMKREVIQRVGLFNTRFPRSEDLEYCYRLATQCNVLLLPGVYSRVRRFDDGSRGGRPVPGASDSPVETRDRMMWHRRAVDSALTGQDLPELVAERVQRLVRRLDDGLAELNRMLGVAAE
jgi:glycosyltransferase involved in cell wall biosynthesis